MATSTPAQPALDVSDLEPIDVEVRNPSVVLSVRLDGDMARALHGLARRRGRRLSDLMREAAANLLREPTNDSVRYVVSGAGVTISVGQWSADIVNDRSDQTHEWRSPSHSDSPA
jgi:hypothetical protein